MAISIWYITVVLIGVLGYTKAAYIDCYRCKESNDTPIVSAPLESPELLYDECISKYDDTLEIILYAHGYMGKKYGEISNVSRTGIIETRNCIHLVLVWEEEASGLLPEAYVKAKTVGEQLAQVIRKLVELGVKLTRFFLVGFSLGAHVVCYAGTKVKEYLGQLIPSIIGLDPAQNIDQPFLEIGVPSMNPSCAVFVFVIHTSQGTYGTAAVSGHADVYVNPESKPNQPGCPKRTFILFTKDDRCCHDRSVVYFVEALRYPDGLIAMGAPSEKDWINGTINKQVTSLAANDTSVRGRFYMKTNPQPLFGMGQDGLTPANTGTIPLF